MSTTKVSPLETACQHCFIGTPTTWATAVTREAFSDTLLRPRCCTEAAVHGVVGIPRGWVIGVRVGLSLRATCGGGRRGRRRRSIRADRRVLGRDRHAGSLEDAKQRLLNTLTTNVAPASPSAKLVPTTPSELIDFVNVDDAHPVSSANSRSSDKRTLHGQHRTLQLEVVAKCSSQRPPQRLFHQLQARPSTHILLECTWSHRKRQTGRPRPLPMSSP